MNIKQLLQQVVDTKASDLHLVAGVPPMLRVDGQLLPISGEGILTVELLSSLVKEFMTSEQLERLNVNKEIDFSLSFSDKARFRINAYTQKGSWAISFRIIPLEIPSIEAWVYHLFSTPLQQ